MSRITVPALGILLCAPAFAQVTQRVSVSTEGSQGNSTSIFPSISAGGRYVAFASFASNLVPGDTNDVWDIFVRDRISGTTERASVDSNGTQSDGESGNPSISSDGRYLAFRSRASNLVVGDTNDDWDIFVRDRLTGTTERVSVATGGGQALGDSTDPFISADGRFVVFSSDARNLVVPGTNGLVHVYVRDRQAGTTEIVSVDSSGAYGDYGSYSPAISADGRHVAFESLATNLVPGDTNATYDVFVHDRQSGATARASVDSSGVEGDQACHWPTISADGRYVAFFSFADNLVPGDTNFSADIFLRDLRSGTTERVSVDSNGAQGSSQSYDRPSISPDGRYVGFASLAANLVPGDTNGRLDIFLRDRRLGTTERLSVSTSGREGDEDSYGPSISADGRFAAFWSLAARLAPGDTNGDVDVFVRDREAAGFRSLCEPGLAGAIGCPCANPPTGAGRGCDNSATTGGAALSAHGVAYLSTDSLVFTTGGQTPTSLSIVMQGNGTISTGAVYGQGVRCVGGTIIRRLFIKTASSGSITAPDFAAGDPTVSARSAVKGDVIQSGQSRWYLVYYRDPIVLGGCPAASTFNATQTGRVDWSF